MEATISKTVKLTGLNAGTVNIRRLTYENNLLVPCNVEYQGEAVVFTYDVTDLLPVAQMRDTTLAQKLQILTNAFMLEKLSGDLSFSLNPENIWVDSNLLVHVLERDLIAEEDMPDINQQIKALCGYLLNKKYAYEDFLFGGQDLYKKNKITEKLYRCSSIDETKELIQTQYLRQINNDKKNLTVIRKNTLKTIKIAIPVLIALVCILAGTLVYSLMIKAPYDQALLSADKAYLYENNDNLISSVRGIDTTQLPKETRYILSRAYVISESLSEEQKKNVLSTIAVTSDDSILNYWIELGRLQYDNAIDYAKRLSDDELLMYALVKYEVSVENDNRITGEEKTKKLSEINSQIDALKKQLDEKENAASANKSTASEAPSLNLLKDGG